MPSSHAAHPSHPATMSPPFHAQLPYCPPFHAQLLSPTLQRPATHPFHPAPVTQTLSCPVAHTSRPAPVLFCSLSIYSQFPIFYACLPIVFCTNKPPIAMVTRPLFQGGLVVEGITLRLDGSASCGGVILFMLRAFWSPAPSLVWYSLRHSSASTDYPLFIQLRGQGSQATEHVCCQ